jgi:Flp pilus assembly pilin Flp
MKKHIIETLAIFNNDESGATATEYIILLILIACFVIAAVKTFGGTVSSKYNEANQAVADKVTFN